ncbi:MAG: DUF1786 domain-containing protein [Desulfovibrionales bacterium]
MDTGKGRTALCLDIGSGTQDVLYYLPGEEIENCPKFVLPAPAVLVEQRIRELAARGRNIYLHGRNMGGGFTRGLREWVNKGGKVVAHPDAAMSISDDPQRVADMGIALSDTCPRGYAPVFCTDFDPGFWQGYLAQIGLPYPEVVLAAAQDHGFHPAASNRKGRFKVWESFLQDRQGRVEELLFETPPKNMTRLAALQEATGGGPVADTGAAAVLGALFVPEVETRGRMEGITVVNVGNSHTIGFLLFEDRILGIYEHHTGLLDHGRLCREVELFRSGELTNETVFNDQGHGCVMAPRPERAGDFHRVYILGPRRRLLTGCGEFLAPGGDMMLAGCFGLLKGARMRGLID